MAVETAHIARMWVIVTMCTGPWEREECLADLPGGYVRPKCVCSVSAGRLIHSRTILFWTLAHGSSFSDCPTERIPSQDAEQEALIIYYRFFTPAILWHPE
ncbi:hypothetical protein CIHG_00263 [Coccidioides immitis H538.4]|uniref:Uncharacterized protein n=2 Tax=Coccidioides immitis TaxID=5501 RepID=A0A0J8RD66_COCIT|nr:hypothetical protein CIRG_07081 [Coccidioides immitis RMSCC 2394]KMU82481.1 hypothetical protein CIHG_00263 [Coccidioides immitis H538.4]